MDFIEEIEKCLGKKAIKNMMGMQEGDVPCASSDTLTLEKDTGYRPKTNYRVGVKNFVDWYSSFY